MWFWCSRCWLRSYTGSRVALCHYLISFGSTLCCSFLFLRRFGKSNRSFRLPFWIFFGLERNRWLLLYLSSFKILFIIFFFEFLISVTVFCFLFLYLDSLFGSNLLIFLFKLWRIGGNRLLKLILFIFLIIFDFWFCSCLLFFFIDFYQIDIWATFITFLCVPNRGLCNCRQFHFFRIIKILIVLVVVCRVTIFFCVVRFTLFFIDFALEIKFIIPFAGHYPQ